MTLSASDMKKYPEFPSRTVRVYLWTAIGCGLFGTVYGIFSHGVDSGFMRLAFLFPLVGGAVFFFVAEFPGPKQWIKGISRDLWHCGIATLTVGSLVRGVLEIYGTTNHLTAWYWWIGGGLLAAGLMGAGKKA